MSILRLVPADNNQLEESQTTNRDAPEKYTENTNRENKRECKPIQYLTRVNKLPTSLGQGRERSY